MTTGQEVIDGRRVTVLWVRGADFPQPKGTLVRVYQSQCIHCFLPTPVGEGFEPAECQPCYTDRNMKNKSSDVKK